MPTTVLLPQPCAASWAAMRPATGGRHCAACAKTVVDFTQKTDAEILVYFQRASAGSTCGRFRAGQLGRPLRPVRARRLARWQVWLAGLVMALTAQSCQPTTLGEPRPQPLAPAPITTLAQDSVATADSTVVQAAPAESANVLEGQVFDAISHQPIANATVRLHHTAAVATTDAAGHFTLQLPTADLAPPLSMVLHLTAAGYSPQLIDTNDDRRPTKGLVATLDSFPLREGILGDVEVLHDKAE